MNFWRIAIREVMSVLKNRTLVTIVLFGQAFYITVFGFVYVQGRVQNVPMTVIDQDQSSLSRSIIQDLDVTDGLRHAYDVKSMDEYRWLNDQGKSSVCVVIPHHLMRDLKAGRAPSVLLYLDGSNVLVGNVAYKAALNVLTYYRVQSRALKLMATGSGRVSAASQALPISVETRSLWLSSYNYSTFMLYGLACIAMQQVSMLGASMVMGLDFWDRKRRRELTGSKRWSILWGKLLGQCLILLPLSVIAMLMPLWFFQMPMRGAFLAIMALMGLYLAVHVLCGIGLGAMTKSPILSGQILLVASAPIFTLSGFTWPLIAMPNWLHNAVMVMPLTHYAVAIRKIALIGLDAEVMIRTLLVLVAWLAISGVWAYMGCRRLEREH